MKYSYVRIVILATLALALCVPAFAGLSPEYQNWEDSPAAFLLTKNEAKEWKKVSTDAEAKKFIDLFWARRNPHPEAAFNAFKARFESMVKYCDENFGYEGKRGALSDRGKVFLLMGPPHQKERRGPTQTVNVAATAVGGDDRGTDEARANVEMWVYEPARLDPAFKAKGSRILFTFYENRPETNEFVMDRSHHEATMALRILRRAPEVYLLHPELESVPKPVSVPGGSQPTDAQLQAIRGTATAPLQEQMTFRQDLGVADADHRPLWLHIQFPQSSPAIDVLAGEVRDASSDAVMSTFQIQAKPKPAGGAHGYDLTFPLGAGSYHWKVGAFKQDVLQSVAQGEIEIPESSDTLTMSPIWLGLSAQKIEKPVLGMAYSFGNWHLSPLMGNSVPHDSQLSYFGYVLHPSLKEGEKPTATLSLTLRKDGKRLGRPLKMDLPLAQVTEDVYLYANLITLKVLPAGPCELDFEVSVPGSDQKATHKIELNLVD